MTDPKPQTSRAGKRKPTNLKYTDEQIIDALNATRGNQAAASRRLKCDPWTIWNRAKMNPAIREVIDRNTERNNDDVERNILEEALDRSNPRWLEAAKLYANARMRKRGYGGSRLEVAGDKDAPFVVMFKPAADE